MKTCYKCLIAKEYDEFSINSAKKDGLNSQCKECHSKYRKQHYNANKQKYIDKAVRVKVEYRKQYYDWLSNQSCIDCGNNDYRVLEHDHLNPEMKSFTIGGKIGDRTLDSLMDEISKCDIVCANCHRIRTIERGGWQR